ncbi:hypothetical protein DJ252_20025 [Salmonella enterica subsp. enterica serovar Uzaramo]|uniref:Uncharacterized protein n=1 Tax=Salmonella enterica TaxID=28901 RepID=A0A760A904_SALER|nr:hypothetical protein [Salmonella enterica]EEE9947239.1 hypothetical protein [Salmonella enterica subsp. enterica serovar Uzaramo]EIM5532505.1 hypothetical protein [Salmonella enterica subsp. enterica]ELD8107700.1 hypothetical protein [Salmonella enterica subsp. enterica serovar Benin]EBB6485195.1 hypothetical protein [Salmonella enterica]
MYDAEKYVISVKFEDIDGEKLYVARVDELPDVEEYADTYDMAYTLALDTIRTTQKFFNEKGMTFPPPSQTLMNGIKLKFNIPSYALSDKNKATLEFTGCCTL